MVETSKLPEHAGDHERLNFQKNIVENIVGVELDELSDEEDKKQEANVEKTSEKLGIAASPEVQSSQAQAPAGNLANPSRANNPEVAGTNLIGLAEVPPGDNPEGIGAPNNPDQVVAEIQASIQEPVEPVWHPHPFSEHMLTLGVHSWTFTNAGVSAAFATHSRWRGVLWAAAVTSLIGLVGLLATVRKKPPRSKLAIFEQGLSATRFVLLLIVSVGIHLS